MNDTSDDQTHDNATLAYQRQLLATSEKLAFEFDRKLVWLSSGAIIVSLLFIEKAIGHQSCKASTFLALAWLSFVAVLVLALINNYLAIASFTNRYKNSIDGIAEPESERMSIIQKINIINIILLGLGIILLSIFCLINQLQEGKNHVQEPKASTETITKDPAKESTKGPTPERGATTPH